MSEQGNHPRHGLDDVIHAPVRLSIMAALAPAERVEFRLLRDTIEVSDSLLSKHITVLEAAGYVLVDKGYAGKRPRTWLSLTAQGRTAFDDYVRTLRRIVDEAAPPVGEMRPNVAGQDDEPRSRPLSAPTRLPVPDNA